MYFYITLFFTPLLHSSITAFTTKAILIYSLFLLKSFVYPIKMLSLYK